MAINKVPSDRGGHPKHEALDTDRLKPNQPPSNNSFSKTYEDPSKPRAGAEYAKGKSGDSQPSSLFELSKETPASRTRQEPTKEFTPSDRSSRSHPEPIKESMSSDRSSRSHPEPIKESIPGDRSSRSHPESIKESMPSDRSSRSHPEPIKESIPGDRSSRSHPEPIKESIPGDRSSRSHPEPIKESIPSDRSSRSHPESIKESMPSDRSSRSHPESIKESMPSDRSSRSHPEPIKESIPGDRSSRSHQESIKESIRSDRSSRSHPESIKESMPSDRSSRSHPESIKESIHSDRSSRSHPEPIKESIPGDRLSLKTSDEPLSSTPFEDEHDITYEWGEEGLSLLKPEKTSKELDIALDMPIETENMPLISDESFTVPEETLSPRKPDAMPRPLQPSTADSSQTASLKKSDPSNRDVEITEQVARKNEPKEEIRLPLHKEEQERPDGSMLILNLINQPIGISADKLHQNQDPLPSDAIKNIVTQIAECVQVMRKGNEVSTTVTLRQPPILQGATITLTTSDQAKGEFNIAFANLSPDAKLLLDRKLQENSLTQTLERKGIVVHIVSTSTESALIMDIDPKSPSDRQQEQQQRHKRQPFEPEEED